MPFDDVYDVLKQKRSPEPASRPLQGGPASAPYVPPPARPGPWKGWMARLTRDRLLLGSLVFVLYSVTLVGIGIAIGRGRSSAGSPDVSAPPARGSTGAPAPYLTVRALELTGGDTVKAKSAAEAAMKELRTRFPQYPVFDVVQGRDRFVCIGRFPVESARQIPDEARRLKESVSTLSFGAGKDRRRFERVDFYRVQP